MSDESRGGATTDPGDDFRYRGNRLGLPESGAGSVPGVSRRLAGLTLDWALALMLAWAAHGLGLVGPGPTAAAEEVAPMVGNTALVVFAVMSILLLTLFGTTVGRRIVGVGIRATGERSWPWFVSMTVRTLLLCLVVPAVVYDRDTRGLHDRAAGTVATRY
ncbi:RDD family protein [Nocardiopsis quinghaiensis]|uniref:RDD family protein n=1 Tax=Nocardiopsis quinghaiensis TaxID=464995 RepID=UPI00123B2F36|nr:RDD family protein [Nocardiopsis quinghaiensis]